MKLYDERVRETIFPVRVIKAFGNVKNADMCLQNYIWDGIKRDRLVWVGDRRNRDITAAVISVYYPA